MDMELREFVVHPATYACLFDSLSTALWFGILWSFTGAVLMQVVDFGNYVQSFPNYYVIGPNTQFFSEHGVRGIFQEVRRRIRLDVERCCR